MPAFRTWLLGLAALAGATPAAARHGGQGSETSAPGTGQTIVVTGRAAEETRRRIRTFVGEITRGATGHLVRFEQPVCPAIYGIATDRRAPIAQRMRAVARAAGMRVATNDCTPNVFVVIVADKRSFVPQLTRLGSGYFGDMAGGRISEIANQPGRTSAWQVFGPPINARGVELSADFASGVVINRTISSGSRITDSARPQFESTFLIIEESAIVGLSTTQVADYAAMRTYARVRAGSDGFVGDTILNVMDAPDTAQVPITLTQWDLAYLRALYTVEPTLSVGAQRGAIAQRIRAEVGLPD